MLVLVGAAVWAGWLWNLPALTQLLTQTGSMKRWTALTIALVGIGIALPTLADRPAVRFLGGALGWLTAAIGVSFLIGYATGIELPHDNWFGYAPTPGWTHPGRPAILSAAGMVPLGLGLALHKLGRIRLAQALSLVPLTMGFLVVVAYMFDLSTPYGGFSLTDMPLPTALAMFVGSLAILGLRADAGYMAIVSSNTAGGRLSRRLLPFAVALPLLVGGLVLSPLQSGRIPAVFALAIVVTAVALLGSVSIWVEASNLRSVDLERAGTAAALRRVTQAEAAQSALAAELAKSSRRLQGILDSALDGFIGLDPAGVITSWNPAVERLYGWTAQEAIGKRFDELVPVFHGDGQPLYRPVDRVSLDDAVARGPSEFVVVRKDGSPAEVEARMWVQEDAGGRSYTVLVRDVADRRRAARALLDLNERLDEFATVAAHDLRGPLASIRGYLEILQDNAADRGDSQDLQILQRMEKASARGVRLIDDLLAYSRAARPTLAPAPVDLDAVARSAADDVTARAERPCEIELAELPDVVGEESALGQVFANLLYNAVHYCPPDRLAQVQVTAEAFDEATMVRIVVADNGAGVPAEERDKIFEMFQRGSTGFGQSGTGVGLAFCRRVVEGHGGHIWVEDGPQGGSRFCLTLPRHFDAAQAAADQADAVHASLEQLGADEQRSDTPV